MGSLAYIQNVDALKKTLSSGATIDFKGDENYATSAARWSDLATPKPGAVINVANEADIEATVQWATQHGVPFVAQSGGHGWASWYNIDDSGIVINMRKLNTVEIDMEKGEAVLGGGCTVIDILRAAKLHKAHIMTGTCNSVGAIPGMLGGGTGYLVGEFGLGADNMLSARLIPASGKAITVSEATDSDLWWAIRGAGHNFGIVSSVTVKAYPQINDGMQYKCLLAFPDTLLEKVVDTIQVMDPGARAAMELLFLRPPTQNEACVGVGLWHAGDVESARKVFRELFELGGMVAMEGMVPFEHANDGLDPLCARGGFKPTYGLSMDKLNTAGLRAFWPEYVAFSSKPTAGRSVVNIQSYSRHRIQSVPVDATACSPALRTKRFHGFVATVFEDEALIAESKALGDSFRAKMSDDGAGKHVLYANFAVGDEEVTQIYGDGERLERLRGLKKKWDPQGVFSRYIPIS